MDLVLLPPGRPGEDLGIAHTLKHWLNPSELWDDVALDVPDEVQPRPVRAALPSTLHPPWERPTDPDGTIRGRWSQLAKVYGEGYAAVVVTCARTFASPDDAPRTWTRAGRRGLPTAVDASRGIILRVQKRHGEWALYTAFRPDYAQFAAMPCPPADAASVTRRRTLYGLRAQRLLSRWGDDEDSR